MKTFLFALIFCFAFANKPPVVSKKFKLCGNELCDEVLFRAKVKRTMNSDHEAFLSLVAGDLIDVTAVKFSDRTDLMEGRLKDGRRGNFYISAIDIGPYIDFLRNAIEIRKEMKKISQDRTDIGPKRVLGAERADLHLVRDYNVQATRYAEEQNLLPPDLLPLPDLTATNPGNHENSHGVGNGHSHGILHGGHSTNLNGASSEEYRNVHSGDAGHLGTLTSNTHPGASIGHVHSSGETVGEQVKPLPTEKLSTSDNQNSVEMEAQSMKSTSPPIPPTTFSPSESLRKEQQPPDAAAVESGTPQPVLTTTTTLGDQYATTTHSIENESIPTQGSSVPFAAPISDSTNETVTTPVTYIPAIMDRYTLSSQSTTVSPPPATGHHDFHVNDSNATSDSDAGAQEASTSRKDRLHIDSNMQAALEAAQKPENSIPSGDGIVSPVNDAVPPSTSPGPPQYCTREDCNYQHSKVNGIQKESAHVVDHVSCSQSVSNSNDGSNPCNDVRKGEEDHGRSGFIAGILRSLTTFVRSFPYLNDVDNAGIAFVINVSLLIGAIVFHLIWSFLSDYDDTDISDRMLTHDLATKCKFLDEQNKVKDMEIHRLGSVADRFQGDFVEATELRKELSAKEREIENHVRRSECLKCELDEERRIRACLENNLTSERKNTLLANEKATEIRRLLDDAQRAHSHTVNELASTRKALERLEKDLHDERKIHEETVVDFGKSKDTAHRLQSELQLAHEKIKKLEAEKSSLELENATLSSMIEESERNRKDGSAGESGGSGGWSDFGDDINGEAVHGKEPPPASSTITVPVASFTSANDIREAAKLRVQLKKMEQDFHSTKKALDKEKEERRQLESKVVALESELERKKREVEERERDRSRADERCNELLAIMKDSNAKARETELLRDKLRDQITLMQHELSSTIEEKAKKEEKIVELETNLKRIRDDHLKLETKRFNEVMELKRKVDVLQANQPVSSPSGQPYDLTQSGSSSLERDMRSPVSLWEETPRIMSCNRTSAEDNLLRGSFLNPKKSSMRVRRSDVAQREHSPSGGEKHKEKKESSHRRVRSRSNGRQLWNDRGGNTSSRCMPVESMCPPNSYTERHHNRANPVYYSSGGSNGGRSPPPEMPLLSAIPPPGVKKPAGKRAVGPSLDFKPT